MISAAFPLCKSYKMIVNSLKIIPNFINETEIELLYSEVNQKLSKLPYLNNHWDQVY